MENQQFIKFLLSPTNVNGAIIKCICLLAFLHHLKTNNPIAFILLLQNVQTKFKGIPLSVCLGLTPLSSFLFSSFLNLSPNTINQAKTLSDWAKKFN
jgi:hypothetical protein